MPKKAFAASPHPHIEGRLEFVRGNSDKFYSIAWNPTKSVYDIRYGRNGAAGQTAEYDADMALKKYKEKIREGYKVVQRKPLVAEVKLSERIVHRFQAFAAMPVPEILARHGSKNVHVGSLDILIAPSRKGLAEKDGAVFPGLHAWLKRLGDDAIHNVREIWQNVAKHEDEEPYEDDQRLAFCMVLAVSDLV